MSQRRSRSHRSPLGPAPIGARAQPPVQLRSCQLQGQRRRAVQLGHLQRRHFQPPQDTGVEAPNRRFFAEGNIATAGG